MVTRLTLGDSQEPQPGLLTPVDKSPLLFEPQLLRLRGERDV